MTRGDAAERLATRLRRLETQIRAFRDLHTREVREAAERLTAIARLQADELQLILDELADIAASVDEVSGTAKADASADAAVDAVSTVTDPAAASPKRARWLAEQERRARLSRRDLLRGREDR